MRNALSVLLRPRRVVHAHCDLPCGVYDPAQARIEAESVKAVQEKYQANDDPAFRALLRNRSIPVSCSRSSKPPTLASRRCQSHPQGLGDPSSKRAGLLDSRVRLK